MKRYLILIVIAIISSKNLVSQDIGSTTPNIIFVLADDLGYADIGVYKAKTIKTPNIDELAIAGLKLTNFYVFPLCSPSRAALMTGYYPPMVGIPGVLAPKPKSFPHWIGNRYLHGLNPNELTIAEVVKSKDYATACIGKWHWGTIRLICLPDRVLIIILVYHTPMTWALIIMYQKTGINGESYR